MHQRCLRGKLRLLLWMASGEVCAICKKPLDPEDWHADHIVPWSVTHDTNVHDMQALCPTCNLKKGAKMKADLDLGPLRDGQRGAFDLINDRISRGEQVTSVVLPTGYGKSDVLRLVAWYQKAIGAIATTLVLSPNGFLRGQIVNTKEKLPEWVERYKLPPGLVVTEIKEGFGEGIDWGKNGEFLVSTTVQLALRNRDAFCHWTRKVQASGKPLLVVADETHTYSSDNCWGEVLRAFEEWGASILVLTATPFREDGEDIFGFDCDELLQQQVQYAKVGAGPTDDTRRVDRFTALRVKRVLIPDWSVSFKDAWDEGVLCHIGREFFDVNLKQAGVSGEEGEWLCELSETRARLVLDRIVRHKRAIATGVTYAVRHLREIRAFGGPDCAMIGFSQNDSKEGGRNDHAVRIKREIERQAPDLQVLIATSADGDEAEELIKSFQKGNGDVLIVKQMASLGVDIPRLKVCLDLSSVRTPGMFIQRVNRCTRLYGEKVYAYLVSPKDCLTIRCFEQLVSADGGEWTTKEEIMVSSDVLEASPPEDKPDWEVGEIVHGGYDDTKGITASANHRDMLAYLYATLSALKGRHSDAEVAQAIAGLLEAQSRREPVETTGTPPPPAATPAGRPGSPAAVINTASEIRAKSRASATLAKRIACRRAEHQGLRDDQDAVGQFIRDVWKQAKHDAGLSLDDNYKELAASPDAHERLRVALETMYRRKVGHAAPDQPAGC